MECFYDALEKQPDTNDVNMLRTLHTLARYLDEGCNVVDQHKCQKVHRRALKGMEIVLGPGHRETLVTMGNLGQSMDWTDPDEAEKVLEGAMAGFEKTLGLAHPDTAGCGIALGRLYSNRRRFLSAETLFCRLVDKQQKVLGPNHNISLRSMSGLGDTYCEQGQLYNAGRLLYKAFQADEIELMERPPDEDETKGQQLLRRVRCKLATHRAPEDYEWESSALWSLPNRKAHFVNVFPDESSKRSFWGLPLGRDFKVSGRDKRLRLAYTWDEAPGSQIDLRVPYLPYEHFLTSRHYLEASTYREYVKASRRALSLYCELRGYLPDSVEKEIEPRLSEEVGSVEQTMDEEAFEVVPGYGRLPTILFSGDWELSYEKFAPEISSELVRGRE